MRYSSPGLPPRYNKEEASKTINRLSVLPMKFHSASVVFPEALPSPWKPSEEMCVFCDQRADKLCVIRSQLGTASSTCAHAIDRMGVQSMFLEKGQAC